MKYSQATHLINFIVEVVGKENPRDVTMQNTGRETKRLVIVVDYEFSTLLLERLLEASPTMLGRISQVTSYGNKNEVDELIKGKASVITIDDLPHMIKICGRIVALNVGSNDWFYTACAGTGCAKKVFWSGVGEFKCPFYNKKTGRPTTREVKMLHGKSSEKLKGELVEGDDDYPPSLNKLLERNLLI
ncbi:hypothetical protein PIB30_006524 [Stylosanthes scabra]|uniref:Uncharacterized protein n=1 Tax=Stylosanthes scabra TaxID=79078 RepID=A0ABU6W634_9FABA|nr:hypothetical protein [Stylosanthes scabra]